MMYRILEISRIDKTLYNTYEQKFNSREDMISYCFKMDNELFFYYGAVLR